MGINLLDTVYEWTIGEYQFWKMKGLTDEDIYTLIKMEDIEMVDKDTCEHFCPRSELLQRGVINIEDVILEIAKYKNTEGMDV